MTRPSYLEPDHQEVPMPDTEPTTVCAECRAGRHCDDGAAWDLTEDKAAVCLCYADGHREQA